MGQSPKWAEHHAQSMAAVREARINGAWIEKNYYYKKWKGKLGLSSSLYTQGRMGEYIFSLFLSCISGEWENGRMFLQIITLKWNEGTLKWNEGMTLMSQI